MCSVDGRAVLGHRRLSIIDLSPGGHQPMETPDGRVKLVFNGEIYNFQELRSQLQAAGDSFRSESDTEVILLGFRRWGSELVHKLVGMFAFAIYDEESQEFFAARDALGIKPLYYSSLGGQFLFASELQPLREVVDVSNDWEAVAEYLRWGSIGAPATLYREIRALEPGSFMRVDRDGNCTTTSYFKLATLLDRQVEMDEGEALERARGSITSSVRRHQVADVDVGVFLSGGVDSVAMAIAMRASGVRVRSVNLVFRPSSHDESRIARRIAQEFDLAHEEVAIDIDELTDDMLEAVSGLDQPSVDGINTYFVSRTAQRLGLKVVVSGVGGDEVFGGYSTFEQVPRYARRLGPLNRAPGIGRGVIRGVELLGSRFRSHRVGKAETLIRHGASYAGAYFASRNLFSDSQVKSLMGEGWSWDPQQLMRNRVGRDLIPEEESVSLFEISQYLRCQLLRDIDAMAMKHSLEVRTPLVDKQLYSELFEIPAKLRRSGPAKRLLRQAPPTPVPSYVWDRQKQGFYFPVHEWLKREGAQVDFTLNGPFESRAVQRVRHDYLAGRLHWSRYWALFVLSRYLA